MYRSCRAHPSAETALPEGYHELLNSELRNFNELKQAYKNASIAADDRVVFNIMGNKYRLVVRIVFEFRAIHIKWFGTHAEYDRIDVTTERNKKNLELRIIRTEEQYEEYLEWVDRQFERKIKPDSPLGKKVQVALLLIKQYEDEHHHIPLPAPIKAIKLKVEELGLRNKDLMGKVGSKGYVSALLNKRKPLTLELAKLFHRELSIPAVVLLS